MSTVGVLGCQRYVLQALADEQQHRSTNDDWVDRERAAVARAASEWAVMYDDLRQVSVEDVERVEGLAIGHVDYGRKLALYVAEIVYGASR